jgi:diaminopimelate decarboxylase
MNNHFHFGGIDITTLANKYKTPLYVYNKSRITENIENVEKNFLEVYDNTKAFYASKAFLTLEMARIINTSKLDIDVASMGECYIALTAGINPSRILYHGNNKSLEELTYAIKNDVGRIVVDNIQELKTLNQLSILYQKKVNILIRFSPKLQKVYTHQNIQTGHKTSKFGFNLDTQLGDIFKIILDNQFIHFLGIHFHVGSQLHTNKNHLDAIDIVFNYIKDIKDKYSISISELNIGGGFGIKYNQEDIPLNIEDFTNPAMEKIELLSKSLQLKRPLVAIEPGRSIVGDAAVTLYKVGTTKQKDSQSSYLTINGGMTDNLRVALYDGKYECDIANKYTSKKDYTYTIVGNACESTDVMIQNISLPKAEHNDIIVVYSTGAYEHSLSNNFNKMLKPCVLMIENENVTVIQRRQTLDDLILRDK